MRRYIASLTLKKSDSEDILDSEGASDSKVFLDSEGQTLIKLKDKGVEALKINPKIFKR